MDGLYKKFFKILIILVALISVSINITFETAKAQTVGGISSSRRAELERELKGLEDQIAAQRQILDSKRRESASFERDVDILNARIKEAKLAIRARDLSIEKLSSDIGGKEKKIGQLDEKLEREKESLAQLLRKVNELDSYSMVEFALSNKTISDFFIDIDSFDSIQAELQKSFADIGENRNQTKEQKETLEDKRGEQLELRRIQDLQKKAIEKQEAEKKNLLKVTKGQEKVYQQILADKEKNAAVIRAALFALRDSSAIPFGKAVEYATQAGEKTGVRPAFILGILRQESNLGENTGQCLVKNLETGSGIGKNTGRFFQTVMKSPRDTNPFKDISSRLGFDPLNMAVSCPPSYGYGGAMGPAQFIPSTWVIYEDKIRSVVGHQPNPWDPRDAFFASAILLKDNGAARGTRDAERLAALRYFAGWGAKLNGPYAFYGNGVMDFADEYQQQIDILKGSGG